jgi:tryptophan synthase alpha subunit
VGFGISRAEHVAELGRQVEAVAVGSAIVRCIERHGASPALEKELESLVRELKQGFGVPA